MKSAAGDSSAGLSKLIAAASSKTNAAPATPPPLAEAVGRALAEAVAAGGYSDDASQSESNYVHEPKVRLRPRLHPPPGVVAGPPSKNIPLFFFLAVMFAT